MENGMETGVANKSGTDSVEPSGCFSRVQGLGWVLPPLSNSWIIIIP